MIKAHVIKLYPTNGQDTFFRMASGVSRFAYNWALQRWKEMYEAGGKPSSYTLIKELNSIKRDQFPWMLDVGKCAPQYAIHNLQYAFNEFFKKNTNYPRFKKKSHSKSFVAVENSRSFKQLGLKLKIPRLGWVRCAEELRFEGKVNNIVVKRIANMWFAVVNVDTQVQPVASESQAVIGVDLGIKYMAVCSDGRVFENPRALVARLGLLRRAQQRLSRKQNGSSNQRKQIERVGRLYHKVSCVKKNAINNATSEIVKSAGVIILENLNIKGMIKNRKLSRSVLDAGMGEFRKQIEYKALWSGVDVVIADRWFPSSQLDHKTGERHSVTLKDRMIYHADGTSTDRDLNAAINLKNYYTGKASGINASGVGVSPVLQAVDIERGIGFINTKISKL